MQGSLQIQLREIKDDGVSVAWRETISIEKDVTYSQFQKQIRNKKKLQLQDYFIYLPQGVEMNQDNFKHIVEHLWRIKKLPRLNIQRLTTNKEWNLGEKRDDEGGEWKKEPKEVTFGNKKKKQKQDVTTISLSGSACDKQLQLSENDLLLLEILNIEKSTPVDSSMSLYSQINEKAQTAIKSFLRPM